MIATFEPRSQRAAERELMSGEAGEAGTANSSRTRRLPKSAINRSPEGFTLMPWGSASDADVPGPPSPPKAEVPLPAAVVIMPLGETSRIRLLLESAMRTFPNASTATPNGKSSDANVAGPPSPEKPTLPLPAIVAMIPLAETFRIRLLSRDP